jgi:2-keto-4-pentenoate hydratase/2-oxohepta-3-ene-1,7-dioic acid hydratase in catechol pathway
VKLVTYRTDGNSRAGLWLKDDRILDIAQAVGSSIEAGSVLALIAGGESAVAALRRLDADPPAAAIVPAGTARLLAPIPRPAKNVFCIGRNYVDHIKEGARALGNDLKLPEVPQIFTKPPTAVIGPDADVRLDPKVTKRLDYEVELGVVIGKGGRDIPRERASPPATCRDGTSSGSRARDSTHPVRWVRGSWTRTSSAIRPGCNCR